MCWGVNHRMETDIKHCSLGQTKKKKKRACIINDTFTFQAGILNGDFRARQQPILEVETIFRVTVMQNTKRGRFPLLETSMRIQFSLEMNI